MTVSSSSPDSLDTRLGRMEGLLTGIQASLAQNQAQIAGFFSEIGQLERRQVELERMMATSQDLHLLSLKVDKLIGSEQRLAAHATELAGLREQVDQLRTAQATSQGRATQAQWALPVVGQWLTVLIALLALIGTTVNRHALQQERGPVPSHQEP